MRFTRAGKSTHQRVAQDSTPWNELKASESEQKQRFQKNKNFSKGPGGNKSFGGGDGAPDGGKPFRGGKGSFGQKSFRGGGGNGKPFRGGGGGGGRQNANGYQMRKDREESANFVKLGDRLKPGEEDPNNDGRSRSVKGYGKSKQVKIFGKFWVPVEDATRLKALADKLKEQGLSRNQIDEALQNERRKAEKAARRARDKICFNCRQFGHVLMDCPNAKTEGKESDGLTLESEICFKCGSTEHVSRDCKKSADKFDFAKCFVCSKTGHIARQCPENTKGIYPRGGCCNICKEITHLVKDCPTLNPEKKAKVEEEAVTARVDDPFTSLEYEGTTETNGIPADDEGNDSSVKSKKVKSNNDDGAPRAKKRKVKF